ncbi:MAG: glycosyltransferase, partial [Candidatus Thermoplasmatota archaeon]|nr:glycosyltransferase [Candidatus Thermoplasmatota archaeon]
MKNTIPLMEIVYGVCSWGLGHATRSLPVIRRLIAEHHSVTVISNGRSLEVLKHELGETATYVDIPDYPLLLSENTRQFLAKSMVYWPVFIKRIEDGLAALQKILDKKQYDCIISDARYDMYSKKIPSLFMSHQMRIMNPMDIKVFERAMERFNMFFFKRFVAVMVPDFRENNLSGDLSHDLARIDEDALHYVGVLSDFTKRPGIKDIDYLISISGPEPQRSYLEKALVDQAHELDGNVVVTLGKAEKYSVVRKKQMTMYSFVSKDLREELLNKTKLVISRSGYSTLMDVAVVGVKALFIPTPGQIEQEYLSKYHASLGTFHSVLQDAVNLRTDVKRAKKTTGVTRE